MVADFERARYCPYCGCLLPKIQEKSSLADLLYETCKSCGETFIAIKTREVHSVVESLKMEIENMLHLPSKED